MWNKIKHIFVDQKYTTVLFNILSNKSLVINFIYRKFWLKVVGTLIVTGFIFYAILAAKETNSITISILISLYFWVVLLENMLMRNLHEMWKNAYIDSNEQLKKLQDKLLNDN